MKTKPTKPKNHRCHFACTYDDAGLPVVMSEWLVRENAEREAANRRGWFVVFAQWVRESPRPTPKTKRGRK